MSYSEIPQFLCVPCVCAFQKNYIYLSINLSKLNVKTISMHDQNDCTSLLINYFKYQV